MIFSLHGAYPIRVTQHCMAQYKQENEMNKTTAKINGNSVITLTLNVINFMPLLAWMLLFPVAVAYCSRLGDPMIGSETMYIVGCIGWLVVGALLTPWRKRD